MSSTTTRILFATSTPLVTREKHSLQILDSEEDENILQTCLTEAKRKIEFESIVTSVENTFIAFSRGASVIHYIGHGGSDNGGWIALERRNGEMAPLQCQQLKTYLQCGGQSTKEKTKLVFVAACQSELIGQVFVDAGVPHVIAVKQDENIKDTQARYFTKLFYDFLIKERASISVAFSMAKLGVETEYGEKADQYLLLPAGGCHDEVLFGDTEVEDEDEVEDEASPACVKFSAKCPSPIIDRNVAMQRLYEFFLDHSMSSPSRIVSIRGAVKVGKSTLALRTVDYMARRGVFDVIVHIPCRKWLSTPWGAYEEGDILRAIASAISDPTAAASGHRPRPRLGRGDNIAIESLDDLVGMISSGVLLDVLRSGVGVGVHDQDQGKGNKASSKAGTAPRVLLLFDDCDHLLSPTLTPREGSPSDDSDDGNDVVGTTFKNAGGGGCGGGAPSVLLKFINDMVIRTHNVRFLLTSCGPIIPPVRARAPGGSLVEVGEAIFHLHCSERVVELSKLTPDDVAALIIKKAPAGVRQEELHAVIGHTMPYPLPQRQVLMAFARSGLVSAFKGNPYAVTLFCQQYLGGLGKLSGSPDCVEAASIALSQALLPWECTTTAAGPYGGGGKDAGYVGKGAEMGIADGIPLAVAIPFVREGDDDGGEVRHAVAAEIISTTSGPGPRRVDSDLPSGTVGITSARPPPSSKEMCKSGESLPMMAGDAAADLLVGRRLCPSDLAFLESKMRSVVASRGIEPPNVANNADVAEAHHNVDSGGHDGGDADDGDEEGCFIGYDFMDETDLTCAGYAVAYEHALERAKEGLAGAHVCYAEAWARLTADAQRPLEPLTRVPWTRFSDELWNILRSVLTRPSSPSSPSSLSSPTSSSSTSSTSLSLPSAPWDGTGGDGRGDGRGAAVDKPRGGGDNAEEACHSATLHVTLGAFSMFLEWLVPTMDTLGALRDQFCRTDPVVVHGFVGKDECESLLRGARDLWKERSTATDTSMHTIFLLRFSDSQPGKLVISLLPCTGGPGPGTKVEHILVSVARSAALVSGYEFTPKLKGSSRSYPTLQAMLGSFNKLTLLYPLIPKEKVFAGGRVQDG